ncbi:probable RNA-directed DNA polymerase from transposon BS [Trichonephila clavipes]|uniref:Probable RNA-directed DNA polymerase from transposon BS n=1 Tax=Trichonephila clavipes TaxID=2585209 RepID=A0A8X6VKY3_TRICX|nr:probable RNA-directed DNA polymerase from transposon BS [Trichonephila clavipes]
MFFKNDVSSDLACTGSNFNMQVSSGTQNNPLPQTSNPATPKPYRSLMFLLVVTGTCVWVTVICKTRIKLDQLLEIALKQDVKVIAVQETKLKESTSLKVKGFNIFRVDRKSKSGGGLAFFVRDINYPRIEYPTYWSDLDFQGIRLQWRGKPLDIINVYHPPNHKPLPTALSNLLNKNSIIVGDLNAKHPSWGCSCSNARGEELLQLLDDTESMILNDGTHTFTSYSYNTSAALDIAITSSELFPQCSWRVLDTIGRDHFPVLICFKRRQKGLLTARTSASNGFLDMTESPAPNGVFGRMLENLGHRGKLRLLDIINLSWKIGRLPAEWKRATIIPIKKAGKNNWTPKDFRPIALTSTTCKIMEKMILIRIQYFLDSKNLIPGEQYGYRRGHSTVDQVISFCQSIRDAQNFKPTHHTMAALLDLTKAFDRVLKHKLLIKLHDTFNIRAGIDKTPSVEMRVGLFADDIVIWCSWRDLVRAGIEKTPSVEMRVGLFADDIVIWCSWRDLVEMERNLNNALSSFSDYALEFKLCFNPTKSIATFFTTNKRFCTAINQP